MNNFKPLITIAVLGCIGYGVYSKLNSKPSAPPPGAPAGWDSAPTVQVTGEGDTASKWGGVGGASNSLLPSAAINSGVGGISTASTTGTTAPTFSNVPASGGSSVGESGSNPATAIRYDSTNNGGAAPSEEKWGTTDPNAAVTAGATAPIANYGDPAKPTGSAPPNGDRIPAANIGTVPGGDTYGAPDQGDVGKQFQAAWEKGTKLLEDGKLVEGLTELSYWHEHPKLSATENQQLTDLLDQVAGSVVYSTQHYTEPAYVVKEGERLEDIAKQYNVPWQLIAKINGIELPPTLRAGEQLKVVRGPFNAVLQLDKRQLTLMLNNMYAGRFVIGIGRDMPPREGTFTVTEKVSNPVYHGRDRTIDADDPSNPLGERWISLGSDLGIHGVGPLTDIGSSNQPGSISLGQRDIEDVFDILSVGSKVLIVR